MTSTQLLGYVSGLGFVAPELDGATLLGTALAANLLIALVCRVMAGHAGYSRALGFGAGLVGGVWAVAVLCLLPRREDDPSHPA